MVLGFETLSLQNVRIEIVRTGHSQSMGGTGEPRAAHP